MGRTILVGPFFARSEDPFLTGLIETGQCSCFDMDADGGEIPDCEYAIILDWGVLRKPRLMLNIRDAAKKVVFWYQDVYSNHDPQIKPGILDAVMLCNVSQLEEYKTLLKAKATHYLPLAAPDLPYASSCSYARDVFFSGQTLDNQLHGRRTAFLGTLDSIHPISFFPAKPSHYQGWSQAETLNRYRTSRINLSVNVIPNPEGNSSIRMWNILGMGGFCLQHDCGKIGNLLAQLRGVATFSDPYTYGQEVKRWLGDPSGREGMRRDGFLAVQERHLYRHRLDTLRELTS